MKKIMLVVLMVVVLAGGYLYLNFGNLITRTAEKIASNALGVKVHIGSIDVSLSDKKVTVNTLEIGNPPGYSKPYAMTVKTIAIGLNTASKKLIDFKDIEVIGSVVNFEMNEKGINLDDLKKPANRKEPKGSVGNEPVKAQKENAGSEHVKVVIQNMVIDESEINPTITLIKRDIKPIRMPAVKVSDIGKGGGVDAQTAIVQVLSQYLTSVENSARNGGLLNGLPGGLGDVQKTLGGAAGGLQKLFK